jgi:two-component SAPR family response regulator
MIGMLLILGQTVLFQNKFSERQLGIGAAILICVLGILNFRHQQHFKDELAFWNQAVRTSPNSAYAIMMLGAKLPDPAEGAKMFRKAYAIDSTEKYINYYYGAMLQYQDSILESERYLLAEKERSDYFECDYMLARVAVQKNDIPSAITYLENFLARAPMHELGNTNLLQLYTQSGDLVKARLQMNSMDQKGIPVKPEVRQMLQ